MQKIKTFEYECECSACNGTGLYIGFSEKEGVAIVCSKCKGSGKMKNKITYKTFGGKTERKGVKRVFQTNPGIVIGQGKNERTGEIYTLNNFGGMSYEDWKSGVKFRKGMEMRKYTCPAWWFQSVDYSKKPDWEECKRIGSFSHCKCFKNKHKCWERWDRENTHP